MMTSPPCAPFLAITSDIADGKLERLAADTGVGALVKPDVNRAGEGERQGWGSLKCYLRKPAEANAASMIASIAIVAVT